MAYSFKKKCVHQFDSISKSIHNAWCFKSNTLVCVNVVLMFTRATQIKTYSWGNAQVVLVANKVDLEEDRQVPAEDGQRLATELGQQRTHANTHIVFLFFNHTFHKK